MRRLLWCLAAVSLASASQAAWVWLYNGEKHVVLPPAEGQPSWASQPDTDGSGRPGPFIAGASLHLENADGQRISRTRVGQTIRLVAVPELGGLEVEPLIVRFHLTGENGEVEVVPDEALAQQTLLGNAPPVFTGQCELPADAAELAGEYEATIEIEVGGLKLAADECEPAAVRVLGPRESVKDKVRRKVAPRFRKAGREAREFGEEVAADIEAWWASKKRPDIAGALKDVQPRQTAGMIERLAKAPGSPLAADQDALAPERAAALGSRTTPERALLVVPFNVPREPAADGCFPLGYVAMGGLRAPGVVDLATVLPWTGEGGIRAGRLVLEAEPGAAEGSIHFEAADGTHLATLPTQVEWFGRVLFPGETHLDLKRQPTPETDGLVEIKLISAIPGGAARVRFTLPLVPIEPEPGPAPGPEEGPPPAEVEAEGV